MPPAHHTDTANEVHRRAPAAASVEHPHTRCAVVLSMWLGDATRRAVPSYDNALPIMGRTITAMCDQLMAARFRMMEWSHEALVWGSPHVARVVCLRRTRGLGCVCGRARVCCVGAVCASARVAARGGWCAP